MYDATAGTPTREDTVDFMESLACSLRKLARVPSSPKLQESWEGMIGGRGAEGSICSFFNGGNAIH